MDDLDEIFLDVRLEIDRADAVHPNFKGRSLDRWNTILDEEKGEFSNVLNQYELGAMGRHLALHHSIEELTQVAATAIRMIRAIQDEGFTAIAPEKGGADD